jgi:hypothetical protein
MAKKALKKHPFGGAIGKFLTGPLGGVVPQLIGKMMGPKQAKPVAPAGVQPTNTSGIPQTDSDMMMKKGGAIKRKAAPKKKMGGMIKRADGSMSKRGLWDNIRANKGSGKKPTAQMLKQEKKIKANTKKK